MLPIIASGPFGLSQDAMGAFLFIWIGIPISLFLGFCAGVIVILVPCFICRVSEENKFALGLAVLSGVAGAVGGVYLLFRWFG